MAFTWPININTSTSSSGYVFEPSILTDVAINDEVFFINNTDSAQFPGLIAMDGVSNVQHDYFMEFQIAPHTSGTTWVAAANHTLTYANSLDTGAAPPSGTIVITDPTAAPTATIASKEASP